MKKLILLFSLILLATLVHAETWQYTTQEIDINIKIDSQITITPEQDDWIVEQLTTKLKFFPQQTTYQKINSLTTTPTATHQDNLLIYQWDNPTQTDLEFSLDTHITTTQAKTEIKEKIHFPIINLSQNLTQYTQSQQNIIITPEIIQLASEITQGEDDLFIAVFQIAQWVKNNINYSIDEHTETFSQPSTWVLENKYGACDEITTLFIALTRALNIPSRYVSGYAYTNWNDLNDFGSHAWAEVYFPNYGWVGFDIGKDRHERKRKRKEFNPTERSNLERLYDLAVAAFVTRDKNVIIQRRLHALNYQFGLLGEKSGPKTLEFVTEQAERLNAYEPP